MQQRLEDALLDLESCFQSEKDWKNIQDTIRWTFDKVSNFSRILVQAFHALDERCKESEMEQVKSRENAMKEAQRQWNEQFDLQNRSFSALREKELKLVKDDCKKSIKRVLQAFHSFDADKKAENEEKWSRFMEDFTAIKQERLACEAALHKQQSQSTSIRDAMALHSQKLQDLQDEVNTLQANASSMQDIEKKIEEERIKYESKLLQQLYEEKDELKLCISRDYVNFTKLQSVQENVVQLLKKKVNVKELESLEMTILKHLEIAHDRVLKEIKASQSFKTNIDQQNISDLTKQMTHTESKLKELDNQLRAVQERNPKATLGERPPGSSQTKDSRALTNLRSTMQNQVKTMKAALSEIQSVQETQKNEYLNALETIRREFQSQCVQARYIWKEGLPTDDQTIPWTLEAANTCKNVFIWRADVCRSEITLTVPGLYHIQSSYFTASSPVLNILVNGEVVYQKPSTSSTQIRSKQLISISNTIAAQSYVDIFLAVPPQATLSVGYSLMEKAQGFLNIRKL